jgi:O-antigen ligase
LTDIPTDVHPRSAGRAVALADATGRWSAVALGAAIPISTALGNALTAVFALAWLLGGQYGAKGRGIAATPVAVAALVLFGLLVLGVSWADVPAADSWGVVSKYRDLALLALFLWVFREPAWRRAGLIGLGLGLALTLAVSYLKFAGAVPVKWFADATPDNPVAFRLQVTHGFLMALAAFGFGLLAWHARDRRWKVAGAVAAGLATVNVLLMVQGRTGYLVLALLVVYLFAIRFRWKGLLAAAALVAVTGSAVYAVSDTFRDRITVTLAQARAFDPAKPAAAESSIGLRLEFYANGIAIVREHPLAGVGTGGFARAYAERIAGSGRIETRNPHNEYLLIAAQLGLPGLAALLALFIAHWVTAARLATPAETQLARGLVLALAAGCLVNALLLDHTEGLLYAWLTGLLFGGYRPAAHRKPGA